MQAKDKSKKSLTILFLESSKNWGGQEERILREISWLQSHGHRAILACQAFSAIAKRATDQDLEAHFVPMRNNFDLSGFFQLLSLSRKVKPDVIHAHSSKDAWLSLWLHQMGYTVVRSRHTLQSSKIPFGRKLIYRHGSQRLIAAAQFIADNMVSAAGIPPERIDVIGECVNQQEFFPGDALSIRQEFSISADAPLFAVIGMLRPEKGQRIFLKAACEVLKSRPDARFLIVGASAKSTAVETEINTFLQSEFSHTPHPPIIMTGFRRDIPAIMRAIDCLVVPSTKEAQTLVIPQAFATGKPAIGSRVGGIPELIKPGINGLLFESRDHNALATAMLDIAGNPAMTKNFGENARQFALSKLTTDKKMQELVDSYRRAID